MPVSPFVGSRLVILKKYRFAPFQNESSTVYLGLGHKKLLINEISLHLFGKSDTHLNILAYICQKQRFFLSVDRTYGVNTIFVAGALDLTAESIKCRFYFT